jgi:hypothetical protein
VMDYVCGEAMLQFAYSYIPTAPALDHRFFYTSNISLKRRFLQDAAAAGVEFDPNFHHAAFEDAEFAFRLAPRGLHIRYAPAARAVHDHAMDLAGFAERESRAGEMAVVFYRKHPGEDEQLQVRWIADLVDPAAALLANGDLLRQVDAFDRQTDALLTATAGSLETLLAIDGRLGLDHAAALSPDRVRSSLNNVLRVLFDVQRTRGKLEAWYAGVEDEAQVRAAQSLASVLRKIEFLDLTSGSLADRSRASISSLDRHLAPARDAIAGRRSTAAPGTGPGARLRSSLRRTVSRTFGSRFVIARLVAADRRLQHGLSRDLAWLRRYQHLRGRLKRLLN